MPAEIPVFYAFDFYVREFELQPTGALKYLNNNNIGHTGFDRVHTMIDNSPHTFKKQNKETFFISIFTKNTYDCQ